MVEILEILEILEWSSPSWLRPTGVPWPGWSRARWPDGHVAEASGVGLELEAGESVVVAGATRHEALAGGEEYELVLATPDPDGLVEAFRAAGLRPPLAIGRCTGEDGVYSLDGGPLPEGGWRHQF